MEKNNAFLDKYVEWIALSVAVLWLAYVGWAYWASPPVFVMMSGKKVDPSMVDEEIKKKADSLEVAMSRKGVPPIDTKKPQDAFAGEMSRNDRAALVDARYKYDSPGKTLIVDGPGPTDPTTLVSELPNPKNFATPLPAGSVSGRSIIRDPLVAVAPVGARRQPPAPAAGGAAGAVPVANAGLDRNWITAFFTYDPAKTIEEFNRVHVPVKLQTPEFLKVEVTREELLPDGSWGKATEIKPLPLHPELTNIPTGRADRVIFQQRALASAGFILRPPFYNITAGSKWRKLGDPDPDAPPVVPVVAPATKPVTPPVKPVVRPRPPAGAFAPNAFTPVYFDVNDTAIDRMLLAQASGAADPAAPAAGAPAGAGDAAAAPAAPKAEEIWVHDDTAQEGKTYRYRARVVIYNPMFNTVRLTADQKMADVFMLQPDANTGWSPWTAPVVVKSHTHFFVGPRTPFPVSKKSIDVTLFQWKDGKMTKTVSNLSPGDSVGATGWTLVDVKYDPTLSDFQVAFVEDSGRLQTHSHRSDSRNAEWQGLNQQVAPPPAPAAGGAPAAGTGAAGTGASAVPVRTPQ